MPVPLQRRADVASIRLQGFVTDKSDYVSFTGRDRVKKKKEMNENLKGAMWATKFVCDSRQGGQHWLSGSEGSTYRLASCSNSILRSTLVACDNGQAIVHFVTVCICACVCHIFCVDIELALRKRWISLSVHQSTCFALTWSHRFGLCVVEKALHYSVLLCISPISCHTFRCNQTGQTGSPFRVTGNCFPSLIVCVHFFKDFMPT